jgi:hypothetical protein
MIYLADELYSAGDSKRAFNLYKQAFANTKDLEVACFFFFVRIYNFNICIKTVIIF